MANYCIYMWTIKRVFKSLLIELKLKKHTISLQLPKESDATSEGDIVDIAATDLYHLCLTNPYQDKAATALENFLKL